MSAAPSRPPVEEVWRSAPQQIHAGAKAAQGGALPEPWNPSAEDPAVIEMGQSDPGSNSWDRVVAVERFMQGSRAARRPDDFK